MGRLRDDMLRRYESTNGVPVPDPVVVERTVKVFVDRPYAVVETKAEPINGWMVAAAVVGWALFAASIL